MGHYGLEMTETTYVPQMDHWTEGMPSADQLAHIPGENGLPVMGNTIELLKDPHAFTNRMVQTYGNVYRSHVLGTPTVSLIGPEANELVLRNRDKIFSNKQGWGPTLDKLFPRGLMLMDFEEHRVDRKALAVAFAQGPMSNYCEALNAGMEREIPSWRGEVAFYPAIKNLALRLAAQSFVGLPWGSSESQKINDAFIGVVQATVAAIRVPLPGNKMKAGMDGRAFLIEYFTEETVRRRKSHDAGGPIGDDIFSQFAVATREDGSLLSVGEVVDQMIFLMMAAHDTITSSATSTTYQLALHPEWQQTLRDEIWSVTGGLDESRNPLPLAYSDLGKLVKTEMVFEESLRMRPPLPVMPRRAMKAFEFGGYHIPAGTPVGIAMHYTQNSPEYWEHPERFDPERFSKDVEQKHHDFAWVPFGGGAHKCLGIRFADMQIKLLMTHLLGRFDIVAEPDYSPKWQAFPIQQPKDGLQVTLRPI